VLIPLRVYERENGHGQLAAHRFCGLSYVLGLPGWVLVAVWSVLVQ
jgi:hypothetical protein